MTIGIPKIPMDDELIDHFTDFLENSTNQLRELRKTLHRLEEITNDICLCGASATAWDALEVQMLGEQWLKLANVWPQDLIIQSHYISGPETEKPWPEHLFRLSLEHQGVIYFTLMTGEQIDQAGIDIIDKDALLRGEG